MNSPAHTRETGANAFIADRDALPRVAVLLATHNGLEFIADQVESILKQESCAVDILVSDDQSTDGTWEWLCKTSKIDGRMMLLPRTGRFGNAARNFYRLLCDVDAAAYDYVALSDQDDIWFEDKLIMSIERLRAHGVAAVSSNVVAVWRDGRKKLICKSHSQRRLDFLFGSAGPGCTYLMTSRLVVEFRRFLAANREEIESVQFHDWMLYAWARSHGFSWHIEARPTVFYRQHDRNEYGANIGWGAFKRRLHQVRSGWYRDEIIKISHLIQTAPAFTSECAETVRLVAKRTLWSRVSLAAKVRQFRRSARERALLVLALMFGGV